jgi:hypothetical protein
MRKLIAIFWGIILFAPCIEGQEWIVPDNRKGKLSPFFFSDETRKKGEVSYSANCMSCHGSPGKGNVINLVPPPPDPATETVQKNSDGEIFYKISEGRHQMPSFKNIFTSNEIWNLVSYLRSYNKSYKQEAMPVITSSAFPGAVIRIRMYFVPEDTTLVLTALAVTGNSSVPVTGAAIRLLVFRTFGLLPIDEEQITNNEGAARFRLPDNLPGDTAGNIRLSARFTDEENFGAFSRDTILTTGAKTIPVSLVAERAMWNRARMAPLWVIIIFLTGLLSVWGFIFYILLKLRDVYIIGETISDPKPDDHNVTS